MNDKVKTINIDGIEVQTSLTPVELADLPQKYAKLQSNWNSLREFFEMIPNYYMDKKSNNNGVYIQEGMERFRKLAIDKMNELEGKNDK